MPLSISLSFSSLRLRSWPLIMGACTDGSLKLRSVSRCSMWVCLFREVPNKTSKSWSLDGPGLLQSELEISGWLWVRRDSSKVFLGSLSRLRDRKRLADFLRECHIFLRRLTGGESLSRMSRELLARRSSPDPRAPTMEMIYCWLLKY